MAESMEGDIDFMSITPVLAQSKFAYNSYISERKLNSRHFVYVNDKTYIIGKQGVLIAIGRWWRNPSYRNEEFKDELKKCIDSKTLSAVNVDSCSESRNDMFMRFLNKLDN